MAWLCNDCMAKASNLFKNNNWGRTMTWKKWLAVSVGILFWLVNTVCITSAADYAHEVKDKKMSFAWSVEGETLAVKISAATEGWVGVGFNPSKKMKDANFVLGYVKKGKAKITDEYGDKATSHKSDKKLGGTVDAVLVGGVEEGGVTTIEFTLPLKSGDTHDGALDVNGDTIVLLAFGAGRDSFKSKHKYRSSFKVNLGSGVAEKLK
jgi:hypothetical protein